MPAIFKTNTMVFTSPIFLFAFLPIIIALYYIAPGKLKNLILLIASLFFYAWGETIFVVLMVVSISINYVIGRTLSRTIRQQAVLAVGIILNLIPLLFFKYFEFITSSLGLNLELASGIHLPLGISFFTFQSISYLVDSYRGHVDAQKRWIDLGVYIAFFPQLIAGPIVRYGHIANQLQSRQHSLDLFTSGVERFILGLAKKLLIANPLGAVADQIFALPMSETSTSLAWVAIICYSLQIFFDFSGYSDMAIGLARMFGFRFLENFNYPYIARSLQDFWRRWHISLSTWFRDYLYIPLGGNRKGIGRTYFNLLIVFFLCGLWHGASWSFVVWGLLHGSFLIIERLGLAQGLQKAPRILGHVYTLLIVVIAWVFFRIEDLPTAMEFLQRLFLLTNADQVIYPLPYFTDHQFFLSLAAGILFSLPIMRTLKDYYPKLQTHNLYLGIKTIGMCTLFFVAVIQMSASTYNPFIYFRF